MREINDTSSVQYDLGEFQFDNVYIDDIDITFTDVKRKCVPWKYMREEVTAIITRNKENNTIS